MIKIKLHIPSEFSFASSSNLLSLFMWKEGEIRIRETFESHFVLSSIENCDYVIVPFTVLNKWDLYGSVIKKTIETSSVLKKILLLVNGTDESPRIEAPSVLFLTPCIESFQKGSENDYIIIPSLFERKLFADANVFFNSGGNIGFVGQASIDFIEVLKYTFKILSGKLFYFLKNNRLHWKIHYPMVTRYFWLRKFEKSFCKCIFIKRKKYSASEELDKNRTIEEYFENISNTSFTFCPRGSGNYSTRFYHTLALGRIPIVMSSYLKLPFEDLIDWNSILLKVSYDQISKIGTIIHDMGPIEIKRRQQLARKVWEDYLSLEGFYLTLHKHLLDRIKSE